MISESGLLIIEKVADRVCAKYTFGFYESEDIRQEALMLGLEAWPRWDKERPWENFVAVHITNRLRSLRRDKYFRYGLEDANEQRQKSNRSKRNLQDPGEMYEDTHFYEEDELEKLCTNDAVRKILDELPPHIRNDFQRIANGVSLSKNRKDNVIAEVKSILGENW
jgi:DNA-directed RNA polymerase specialized sigma24 family protein